MPAMKQEVQDYLKLIEKRKPYVQMSREPICSVTNYNAEDFVEMQSPLFHVFISDGILKLVLVVKRNNEITDDNQKEVEVVRAEKLYIDGINPDIEEKPDNNSTLSVNTMLVQAMFDHKLAFYGLRLNKVAMFNYRDFESVDFSFIDYIKKEALYSYIENIIKEKY